MSGATYHTVSGCPWPVRVALDAVGYGGRDVAVRPALTFSPPWGGDGTRGYVVAFRLDGAPAPRVSWGSWGGPNPFEARAVDSGAELPIPEGTGVIVGTGTDRARTATVLLRPENVAPLLPAPVDLTRRERAILAVIRSYTSAGRKDWQRRHGGWTDDEIGPLVAGGFLAVNRAGAVSVTTAGRNVPQPVGWHEYEGLPAPDGAR